jgi:hypothetical protein
MNSANSATRDEGLTLRQAALIAGFGYLLSPVTYAEFSIYPELVISGNIEQTVQNIATHSGLFAAANTLLSGRVYWLTSLNVSLP